ncbi:MAG: FKBP-type peptidyl-prolyl cis-trans isomerase [Myxococcota bacterium]|nr:FKBP-type peptidyl-prolyl cis-trans isomerase [Myxococcota bacterium]
MSRHLLLFAAIASLIATPVTAEVAVESEDDKAFYLIGLNFGRQLYRFYMNEREAEIVGKAIVDSVNGNAMDVDPRIYGPKVSLLQDIRAQSGLKTERKKSTTYLAKKSREAGAKKMPSGLIYTEIEAGSGDQPESTDTVSVHYTGRLRDGSVFDSSVERGEPAEFPLSGVIPCWTEGVAMMKVGGKAELVCPADIAYGETPPRGSPIPPGSVLAFEVELLKIVP